MKHRLLASILVLCLVSTMAVAQMAPSGYVEVFDYYTSGVRTNTSNETAAVYSMTLNDEDAHSLRLIFGNVQLGANDFIEVYNPTDRQRHILTPAELSKWQNSSAFFNGGELLVRLFLAPFSVGSFEIVSYYKGVPQYPIGQSTICGATDDRVVSTDFRTARFSTATLGGGCTIWLCSSDNCVISAGHCFSGGTLVVAEFEPPASDASGALNHPPVDRQYTIDGATLTFTNGGIGNDWGVCRLMQNNLGQNAADVYGFYPLGFFTPTTGDPLRITGCGSDTGVENQTLQTHVGPYQGAGGSGQHTYMTDTTGGNSGSPVIDDNSGMAVGVHTHGGCNSTGGANSGTMTTVPAFQAAFNALCNLVPTIPVASFNASATTILAGQSVNFSSTSTGVPTTFSWDFNGDLVADATTASASFQYNTPGMYSVTLSVSNMLGSDTITMTNLITVNAVTPASVPYSQDFQGGLPLTGEWFYQSDTADGRITTGGNGTQSPGSGNPAMILDSAVSGNPAVTNDAILSIDLLTTGGAILVYWFKETLDENDPDDGLWLSDGVTEVRIFSHEDGPQDWTLVQLDLTALAAANGIALTTSNQIIFRQRDNFSVGTDGLLVDDIDVLPPAVADIGQPNTAASTLTIPGAVDQNGLVPTIGQNGPFFATAGATLTFDLAGPANEEFVLLTGPLNRNNQVFSGLGSLDIGLLGPGNFSDLAVVIDGTNPSTFLDLFGIITAAGTQHIDLGVPAFLSGVTGAFQAAVLQGAALPIFTAATEVMFQ